MHTNTGARVWRVTLTDGRTVEVRGRKVVVTDSGALMLLADGNEPRHIFAHWAECVECQPRRRDAGDQP